MSLRSCKLWVFAGALAASGAQAQLAQPIRVVVPFTPGTGMDIIARTVAPRLSERMGQPVIVENKPGASGNIGAEAVAKSAPDGNTLMVSANTMVITPSLYQSMPYDAVNDFAPISLAAWGTLALVASTKSKIESVQQLIAEAKARPGKLSYGSPGVGTPHHLAMELFKDLTGTFMLHIPYKGSAGAVTDLLSGQIDVMFLPIHVAMPQVRAGRIKALAVGSPKRHPSAPELATLQELGIKGAEVDMWYGFLAPKGTPAPVISKLNTEIRAILQQPEVKEAFEKQGLDASFSSPEELKTRMARDYTRWNQLIKKNHITAE
jgi:tripartite-type tricarboxylate transporter receptor subunit TctC